MRKIAIVGAGQAGLYLAFGLLRHRYQVTVFSDAGPEEILDRPVPSTAFLFDRAVGLERELGLDHWRRRAPEIEGIHLELCAQAGERSSTLQGRFQRPGQAIDHRLKSSSWMNALADRGGRLVVGPVRRADLEALALSHDLVVVATGKGDLSGLFRTDRDRSPYDRPRRKLTLLTVAGLVPWPDVSFCAVRVTFVNGVGEIFWVPFFDRQQRVCSNLLFEADPGGPMDRFDVATSPRQALRIAGELVRHFTPWAWEPARRLRLADACGWQRGAITPTVRRVVARLPSGRILMALGDAAVLNDPITGQGANSAAHHARCVCQSMLQRGRRPFDAGWMERVFEAFWEGRAKPVTALSNLLLEPTDSDVRRQALLAVKRSLLARLVADSCGPTVVGTVDSLAAGDL